MPVRPVVEGSMVDVARHLLGADQHALDLGVVDRGEVRPAIGVDIPSSAFEQGNGRFLQTALGDSQL